MRIDHAYHILDLEPGASDEQIRTAYRDLSKVWHPDRFANDPAVQRKAEEKLKAINEAYRTILREGNESGAGRRGGAWPPEPEADLAAWGVRTGTHEVMLPDYESLADLVGRGRIGADAEVRPPGSGGWMRLGDVPELKRVMAAGKLRRRRSWAIGCALAAVLLLFRRPSPWGLAISAILMGISIALIVSMRGLETPE
ncbi:MAG TPA: DnaJ domain-containing protein [Thermoanaerobaculia bacterium]|nr:DnaJ domain-containing protein [Thermoanaerobaculia bacterium]